MSVTTVLPQVRFSWAHGGDAVFFAAKDAEFYAAQVRHVADGTYGFANDILFEWSRGTDARSPPWTYWLLARLWSVSGVQFHWFLTFVMVVTAVAQFALFAAIGRTCRLSARVSIATATACCLAPFLWSYTGTQLWLGHPDQVTTGFLPLARPVNPSLSSVLVWGGLLAWLRWLERPRWWVWGIATLAVAAAWSAYPAAFLFLGATLLGICVAEALGRRWRRVWAVSSAGGLALIVNIRSMLAAVAPSGAEPADTAVANLMAVPTREPILTANVATIVALTVGWLVLRSRRRPQPVRAAMIVGPAIGLLALFNLQVVTGRIDQPFHYDWFYSVPCTWVALAIVCSELRPRLRRLARIGGSALARRIVLATAGGFSLAVAALAFGGPTGARVLRALGAIRSDHVARPGLIAALAVGAALVLVGAHVAVLRHRWKWIAVCLVISVGLGAAVEGWRIQDHGFRMHRDAFVSLQPVAPALAYVEAEGTIEDVVAASDDRVARLVPPYTGRNVLISAEVQFANAPPDVEFRRRRLLSLALFGLEPEQLAAGLGDGGGWHTSVFKWRTFAEPSRAIAAVSSRVPVARLEPDEAQRVLDEYRQVRSLPRSKLLREFRVDWVLWSERSTRLGLSDPGEGDGLELAWEGPACRLYRVVAR